MSYQIKINPTITRDGMLNLFWDAVCGGSIGFGMIDLDCESETYAAARERVKILKAKNPDEYITGGAVCYGDVLTEVLRAGGKLMYREYDSYDDQCNIVEFDVDHLIDNLENVDEWILKQMMSHDYDSITTDSLLQCLLVGEIRYC